MSQLKLSAVKATQSTVVELEVAHGQISELNRMLSAEKQASKSLAAKLSEARAKIDDSLASKYEAVKQELEALQTAQQIQRLEGLIGEDAKTRKLNEQLKQKTSELNETKKTLKGYQAFDPERQKRQLAEQKKRIAEQAALTKELNKKLKAAIKEASEFKREVAELKKAAPSDEAAQDEGNAEGA